VGSTLVRALMAGAQVRGVTSVTMDVMYGNTRALAMIKRHWPAARSRRSRDFATICVQLTDYQERRPPSAPGRPSTRSRITARW
jgi:hypothetical protein